MHYAGLIPARPGKSHQSIRDISLLAALPGILIIQPANPAETHRVLAYCIDEARGKLRLAAGDWPFAAPD